MKTTTIFDSRGSVLASLELHEGGHAVLRDSERAVHAFYDSTDDTTRDAFNRIIARGDQTERLLPFVCQRKETRRP